MSEISVKLTHLPKVENAIFKVHRSFLAKQSSAIKDMLEAPQSSTNQDGTDERPLVLTGDSAASWELLLESLYERYVSNLSTSKTL
jgi:hypothetical protein